MIKWKLILSYFIVVSTMTAFASESEQPDPSCYHSFDLPFQDPSEIMATTDHKKQLADFPGTMHKITKELEDDQVFQNGTAAEMIDLLFAGSFSHENVKKILDKDAKVKELIANWVIPNTAVNIIADEIMLSTSKYYSKVNPVPLNTAHRSRYLSAIITSFAGAVSEMVRTDKKYFRYQRHDYKAVYKVLRDLVFLDRLYPIMQKQAAPMVVTKEIFKNWHFSVIVESFGIEFEHVYDAVSQAISKEFTFESIVSHLAVLIINPRLVESNAKKNNKNRLLFALDRQNIDELMTELPGVSLSEGEWVEVFERLLKNRKFRSVRFLAVNINVKSLEYRGGELLYKLVRLSKMLEFHMDIFDILINRGADLNYEDSLGWTPLVLAALLKNPTVVKKLLSLKAKVTNPILVPERELRLSHFLAFYDSTDFLGLGFIGETSFQNNDGTEVSMIEQFSTAGLNFNLADGEGNTPAHHAVSPHNFKNLKILYKLGFKLNRQNRKGQTPRQLILTSNLSEGEKLDFLEFFSTNPNL